VGVSIKARRERQFRQARNDNKPAAPNAKPRSAVSPTPISAALMAAEPNSGAASGIVQHAAQAPIKPRMMLRCFIARLLSNN
jgi:hypothetical protein